VLTSYSTGFLCKAHLHSAAIPSCLYCTSSILSILNPITYASKMQTKGIVLSSSVAPHTGERPASTATPFIPTRRLRYDWGNDKRDGPRDMLLAGTGHIYSASTSHVLCISSTATERPALSGQKKTPERLMSTSLLVPFCTQRSLAFQKRFLLYQIGPPAFSTTPCDAVDIKVRLLR
jgi:hypothetical protein